jgi:hypothetical protein
MHKYVDRDLKHVPLRTIERHTRIRCAAADCGLYEDHPVHYRVIEGPHTRNVAHEGAPVHTAIRHSHQIRPAGDGYDG